MTTLFESGVSLPEICRNVSQIGISLLIQSTLLLALGLGVGRRLAARGAAAQSLVYRATLAAVVLGALLSVLLAGAVQPLWSLSLPASPRSAVSPPAPKSIPGWRSLTLSTVVVKKST